MIDDARLSASEREVLELLPWYVNGTLQGEERERVRGALRSSLTCRLEYERLNRMQALMQDDDAEQAAADRGFDRLMARIQSDAPAAAAATPRPPRWLRLAQAAAVVALVGGAVGWWTQDAATGTSRFRTLTTESPQQARQLRVVFAPGVSDAERMALLAPLGVRILGPPTADGVYTVELPKDVNARGFADRLREDPRVALVTTPPESEAP
jgi:hypothetical protein